MSIKEMESFEKENRSSDTEIDTSENQSSGEIFGFRRTKQNKPNLDSNVKSREPSPKRNKVDGSNTPELSPETSSKLANISNINNDTQLLEEIIKRKKPKLSQYGEDELQIAAKKGLAGIHIL